ncbi:MAG: DUF11 domain-containing protein [Candidatus Riflebacteria bacterium]|nr:DUF11 domain-containing protein [Candidatus Riflebacteria bacterium]
MLALPLLLAASPALALTPAGTIIRNQASATFVDALGAQQTAVSNEVVTIVQAVYGLSVTPDGADNGGQTQSVTPGSTVYMPYVLTNAGNEKDQFKLTLSQGATQGFTPQNAAVYEDTNGNGVVDPGDVRIAQGFGVEGTTRIVDRDEQVNLIVTYQVPTGALAGVDASVNLSAVSNADGTKTDLNNFSTTAVVNDAAITVSKSVSPADSAAGGQVTYTISGSNTGSAGARGVEVANVTRNTVEASRTGVLVYDNLALVHATGVTFNANVGTPAPNTGYIVYEATGGKWTDSLTDPNLISPVRKLALFVEASPATATVLTPGQAYSFRFTVDVANTVSAGSYRNSAFARFSNSGGTEQYGPNGLESNQAILVVGGRGYETVNPQLGPRTDPTVAELGTDDHTDSAANRPAGSFVTFTVAVKNSGNANDTYSLLTVSNAITASDSTVEYFRSDGNTPLGDSNSDGVPDTGLLAPEQTFEFSVKVYIPANASYSASNVDIRIRSRSTLDTTKTNDTILRIPGITSAGVLLGNNDSLGGSVSSVTVTKATSPGLAVEFPLDVINQGGFRDTFELRATVPAGLSVVFFIDSDNDQVLDSNEALPVSDTGVMEANAELHLIAQVTVASGATTGDNNVTFTATSTNDTNKASSQLDVVTVKTVRGVTVQPNRSGIGIPGGTVTFRHTVKNTSTITDTFVLTMANNIQDWAYRFQDANSSPITQTSPLAPGASQEIQVVRFIPQNEPVNTVEQFQVVATGTASNAVPVPSSSALDTVSVINGNLEITKTVVNFTTSSGQDGKPGEVLLYTVTYRNLGNAGITTVVLFDTIPQFTQFVSGSVTGTNPRYSANNGTTYVVAQPDPATSVTNLKWEIGDLAAGANGTVTFKVTIQ